MNYKGNLLFNRTKNQWTERDVPVVRADRLGRGGAGHRADTGPGLDTGVFVQPFNTDFGKHAGAELMLSYLNTEVGDAIEFVGSWSASAPCTTWSTTWASTASFSRAWSRPREGTEMDKKTVLTLLRERRARHRVRAAGREAAARQPDPRPSDRR